MLKRLKIPISLGLAAYGAAYFIVKSSGFNSTSFTIISYLYIALAVILGLRYEVGNLTNSSSLISTLKNIVIVIEGEEMKLKRLFTGEKYKLKGEIEKV
jgi:hypothetical protein